MNTIVLDLNFLNESKHKMDSHKKYLFLCNITDSILREGYNLCVIAQKPFNKDIKQWFKSYKESSDFEYIQESDIEKHGNLLITYTEALDMALKLKIETILLEYTNSSITLPKHINSITYKQKGSFLIFQEIQNVFKNISKKNFLKNCSQ